MTQFEKLDLLLRECGGTIQTFQVLNNGISKSVFYAYVKERGLEQAAHGVYVSPDTWTDAMYLLHLRCGQAVFSHETALFFHDLTDREPLKYNASLHFLYRHVDIITLLSCTLSESDCIYQKRSQQFIHALLTSYNTTHFIYFAASQTIFLFLNITSVFPPSLYIPPDSNIYQLHE